MSTRRKNLLAVVGPGILVAATGVGAGDLATASFTGSVLGLTVLWAVVLGAFLKFVLNEGLTRWQLATGDTLLEGCVERFGRPVQWFFLCYLVIWSFLVGAALMSAVGLTCHAIYPLFGAENANLNKIFYGVLHSAIAILLVRVGGYGLFEKIMSVCIGVMFVVVVLTAVALRPPLANVITGVLWPTIPPGGVLWTVALMGGVGGTLTVMCYGYWIREEGRQGVQDLNICRIDLATGYVMTAIFGLAMVIIGSRLGPIAGGGAMLIVDVARQLEVSLGAMGAVAKWTFLLGAWGAVFSSLLGVWQSMPYLFADFWFLTKRAPSAKHTYRVDTKSLPYQAYLFGIALIPIIGLVAVDFITMQKTYAVVGALFIPMLAIVLLTLNGRAEWVGAQYKNTLWTSLVLIGTLLFFLLAGWLEIRSKLMSNKERPQQVALQPAPSCPGGERRLIGRNLATTAWPQEGFHPQQQNLNKMPKGTAAKETRTIFFGGVDFVWRRSHNGKLGILILAERRAYRCCHARGRGSTAFRAGTLRRLPADVGAVVAPPAPAA